MSKTKTKSQLISCEGGLEITIAGNPDFGHLRCRLPSGASLIVESGAMATMSRGMEVQSRLLGGFVKSLLRKLFGGESLFVGEYSHPGGGSLDISPGLPGMVLHRQLRGESVFYQAGAYLACTPGITLTPRFGGLKALFGGEGLVFLEIAGRGDLFINAVGTIEEREVDGRFVVDTGHVVGWESTLDWTVRGMGSMKSTLLSGEGLVIEFNGRGKVWLQTRTLGGLAGWIAGYC